MNKRTLLMAVLTWPGYAAAVEFGPGPGFLIPDITSGVNSSIIVSGQPPICANLNWVRVSFGRSSSVGDRFHTWAGDLIVQLTHVPSGTSSHLFSRVGSTTASGFGHGSDLFGAYRFFESGASFVAAGGAGVSRIPEGDYSRSSHAAGAAAGVNSQGVAQFNPTLFSAFAGQSMNGEWRLTISDHGGGDIGDLVGWSFDASPVPEPASISILLSGILALGLRERPIRGQRPPPSCSSRRSRGISSI